MDANNKPEMRQRELLEAMAQRWNRGQGGNALAEATHLSRYHFQRTFRSAVGETPGKMRRRLLLERAACELRTTSRSVTEIALDTGYQSLEGFGRAFKGAFGQSPSSYRAAANQIRLLPGRSGIHFDSSSGSIVSTLLKGLRNMDLVDRLLESDYQSKLSLFQKAALLTDAQLDAPLAFRHNLMPWVEPARTLRESLNWMVCSHWVDSMFFAVDFTPSDTAFRTIIGNSVHAMQTRFESYHKAFQEFVQKVRTEELWDTEWVDTGCEPAETFAIGAVIEQTMICDIAYRLMLHRQLDQFGFGNDSITLK
ncbi:MAG: hypothetical protein OHK0029_35780 [Armatimonadaceae bacterium]